jgi:hypothetical protein
MDLAMQKSDFLQLMLQAVLDGLIGHNHNQIGDAVYHLQFALQGLHVSGALFIKVHHSPVCHSLL